MDGMEGPLVLARAEADVCRASEREIRKRAAMDRASRFAMSARRAGSQIVVSVEALLSELSRGDHKWVAFVVGPETHDNVVVTRRKLWECLRGLAPFRSDLRAYFARHRLGYWQLCFRWGDGRGGLNLASVINPRSERTEGLWVVFPEPMQSIEQNPMEEDVMKKKPANKTLANKTLANKTRTTLSLVKPPPKVASKAAANPVAKMPPKVASKIAAKAVLPSPKPKKTGSEPVVVLPASEIIAAATNDVRAVAPKDAADSWRAAGVGAEVPLSESETSALERERRGRIWDLAAKLCREFGLDTVYLDAETMLGRAKDGCCVLCGAGKGARSGHSSAPRSPSEKSASALRAWETRRARSQGTTQAAV